MDAATIRIRQILAATLQIDEARVVPAARILEDLGASSLDTVDAVMEIEDAFHVEISDAAAAELRTVGDVIAFVEKKKRPLMSK